MMNWVKRLFTTPKPRTAGWRRRAFKAGGSDRLTARLSSTPTTADQDIASVLVPLRVRARELEQNESLAKRYIALSKKNIPGAYGFTLKMKTFDLDRDGNKVPDKGANQKIMTAWADWCKAQNCDVTGQETFRSIQHIIINHVQRDGEFLVRKIRNKSKHGFQLQLLEPDLIDEKYTATLGNGNVVIMGIEFDQWRRRVAFHLQKSAPSTQIYGAYYTSGERERIPASEIIYGFEKLRALQSRGVTKMHAAILRMDRLEEYDKAAGMNAVNAARRLGFFEPVTGGDITGDGEDSEGNIEIDVDEASFYEIPKGYKAVSPDPKYPDAQHEMFMKTGTKLIASGLDVGYITLANDLTETSYGSGRIGLLDERESWMMQQEWFIEAFLEPVFEGWLEMAMLTVLDLPPDFEKYNHPYFIGKRWPWIDPGKDMEARQLALQFGLTSLTRIAAEQGDDLEEIFQERQAEQLLAEKYGVSIDVGQKPTPSELPEEPDEEEEPEEEPDDEPMIEDVTQPKKKNGTLVPMN